MSSPSNVWPDASFETFSRNVLFKRWELFLWVLRRPHRCHFLGAVWGQVRWSSRQRPTESQQQRLLWTGVNNSTWDRLLGTALTQATALNLLMCRPSTSNAPRPALRNHFPLLRRDRPPPWGQETIRWHHASVLFPSRCWTYKPHTLTMMNLESRMSLNRAP